MPENGSLKDKRRIVKSMIDRLHRRFNVAVAEVDRQDEWQRSVLGLACVSNDRRHAGQILNRVIEWIQGNGEGLVADFTIEIL